MPDTGNLPHDTSSDEVPTIGATSGRGASAVAPSNVDAPTVDAPRGGAWPAVPLFEGPGSVVGPFELVRVLGEGGFGTVFEARQTHPIARSVALKIIKAGMDTRAVIARFEAERQALAMMDHPHIARVLDAGATAAGRPYFVMELVGGRPITAYCDGRGLALRERLALFLDVCAAVQHAHQKGIVHRDLKPSNVLVSEADGKPVVKVIDFGIAKAIIATAAGVTQVTADGQMIGTPAYMSPEQAGAAQAGDVDTRTDVYALGVVLYELLTGVTPLEEEIRTAADVARVIREVEPRRPSARLTASATAAARAAPPGPVASTAPATGGAPPKPASARTAVRRLAQQVRGDLDWVVMKCLEKDRARRYDGVAALAEDVRRFLAFEPVAAGPPSRIYRFRKFARRNRAPLAVGLAIASGIVAGLIVAVLALGRERVARAEAEQSRKDEAAQRKVAVEQRTVANEQRVLAETREKAAEAAAHRARQAADRARATNFLVYNAITNTKSDYGGTDLLVIDWVRGLASNLESDQIPMAPEGRAAAYEMAGQIYKSMGMRKEAEYNLRRSVDLRRKVLGNGDDEELAFALASWGDALTRVDPDKAENPLADALAMYRRLGTNKAATAETLLDLAKARERAGKLEQAAADFAEALALSDAVLPATRPEFAGDCLLHLGGLRLRADDPAGAAPLLERALAQYRAAQAHVRRGDKMSDALTMLARAKVATGDAKAAVSLLRETLPIDETFRGRTSVDAMATRLALADALARSGDAAGAQKERAVVLGYARGPGRAQRQNAAALIIRAAMLTDARGDTAAAVPLWTEAHGLVSTMPAGTALPVVQETAGSARKGAAANAARGYEKLGNKAEADAWRAKAK